MGLWDSDNGGVSEDPATRTDWAPTDIQVRVLKHFQGLDYDCTVIDGCAACEVGRRTFYDWFGKPEFARWWQEQAERWASLQMGRTYGAIVRSATGTDVGGSPADRKMFLERFDKGYAPRRREELSTDGPLGITVHITKTYSGDESAEPPPATEKVDRGPSDSERG